MWLYKHFYSDLIISQRPYESKNLNIHVEKNIDEAF